MRRVSSGRRRTVMRERPLRLFDERSVGKELNETQRMTLKRGWPVQSTNVKSFVISSFAFIIIPATISDRIMAFPRCGKYLNRRQIKDEQVMKKKEGRLKLSHPDK